ncbi:hypothetical protein [Anaeromassilibacillus senegalensis]|uniref:Uncharacterized protein n=1 Tax=Anaeromassilibacillus senegalensis TaxID=1673717 RepID=A0ABS9CRN2_9FIRM|nr:hypothetical protein [Anaeromassilibacillus senegalensis]MCF2652935.1 hypothetical protein [Anaeromassilibacillus senegalensis]
MVGTAPFCTLDFRADKGKAARVEVKLRRLHVVVGNGILELRQVEFLADGLLRTAVHRCKVRFHRVAHKPGVFRVADS